MFFDYEADQDASPHRPNRQHDELLKLELMDAGFDIVDIERAMKKCPPLVVEIAGRFAASCSFQKRSAAEMFSNIQLFREQADLAANHENFVIRHAGEALLQFQAELMGGTQSA